MALPDPPPADVSGHATALAIRTPAQRLFAPSQPKLLLLGITTLGLYVQYWYYRNWSALQLIQHRPGIMPVWRAGFGPLWSLACFRALARVIGPAWPGSWLSATLLGLAQLLLLPFALVAVSGAEMGVPVLVLTVLLLLPVNAGLRRFKQGEGVDVSPRERLDAWNWLLIVPMGLIQLLLLAMLLAYWLAGHG